MKNQSVIGRFPLYDVQDPLSALRTGGSGMPPYRRSYLKKMVQAGGERYLTLPMNQEPLSSLGERCPNFSHVTEEVTNALALALAQGSALDMSPILLIGHSGIGKTHYARELAQVLGFGFLHLSMSSASAGWLLGGAVQTWQYATPGKVTRSLVEDRCASRLMLVDELDKANQEASKSDPLGPLYDLLEPSTSVRFTDEYLATPIDASYTTWVATANDERDIPASLLHRFVVFEASRPTPKHMAVISSNLYRTMRSAYPKWAFDEECSLDVIERLSVLAPRDVHHVLKSAFGRAVRAGRHALIPADIKVVGTRQITAGFGC